MSPLEPQPGPDGYVTDPETGEVTGYLGLPDYFAVDSDDTADWVLEKRSEIEGTLAGIDARSKALNEQLAALRSAALRRLSYWEYRFGPSLTAYARSKIEGKRTRTAQFTWGRVSFRKTPPTTAIVDMAEAVEWVKSWRPELVKRVETVAVKDVLAVLEAAREDTGDEAVRLPFLATSEGGETADIRTGVEAPKGKGK